jgi:dienelactone hydrolase
MIRKTSNNKNAVIILHEIYGINSFIEEICTGYKVQGFDVFCPDMIQRERFLYPEAAEAYQYFMRNNGFEYYKEIEALISKLKLTYDKVFIIGFSVGATIAWRCCEHHNCDGIICCYGSRIREYMSLQPSNSVLLLFAKHDSFDVEIVAEQLGGKPNVDLLILQASHGFMDRYSNCFNKEQAQIAKMYIRQFLIGFL